MIGFKKANRYAKLITARAAEMPSSQNLVVIASVKIVRLIDHYLHDTFPYELKYSDRKEYIALKYTEVDGNMTHTYILTILDGDSK